MKMTDLEDVMTNLEKIKDCLDKSSEFVRKLIRLFGSIDAMNDQGAESLLTSERLKRGIK